MATAPIMVVGGSGFVGSHVCRELAEQKLDVICFDIQSPEFQTRNSGSSIGSIRFVKGDILDPDSLSDCVRNLGVGALASLKGIRLSAAPSLGQHNAEILTQLGYTETERQALVESGVM